MGDRDREADFSAYLLARQRALIRFAYLLTGNTHEAEDVVQAALLKVYRRWGTIESPDSYVRRAIVNEYRSWWRRPQPAQRGHEHRPRDLRRPRRGRRPPRP